MNQIHYTTTNITSSTAATSATFNAITTEYFGHSTSAKKASSFTSNNGAWLCYIIACWSRFLCLVLDYLFLNFFCKSYSSLQCNLIKMSDYGGFEILWDSRNLIWYGMGSWDRDRLLIMFEIITTSYSLFLIVYSYYQRNFYTTATKQN